MEIKPIINEQEYQVALRTVEPMFDCEPQCNTPEGEFFEAMCVSIAEYEKKYYSTES